MTSLDRVRSILLRVSAQLAYDWALMPDTDIADVVGMVFSPRALELHIRNAGEDPRNYDLRHPRATLAPRSKARLGLDLCCEIAGNEAPLAMFDRSHTTRDQLVVVVFDEHVAATVIISESAPGRFDINVC